MGKIQNIVIIGGGGHSKVVVDIINTQTHSNYNIIGYFDDDKKKDLCNIPYLGEIKNIKNCESENYHIIAIGNIRIRRQIYKQYNKLRYISLVHHKSIVSQDAIIEEGTVICAGAIVQPKVKIGKCCIINTNSNIDHESIICDFVNINPSATLCGNVLIGKNTIVGANATIIEKIKIGKCNIIGAGSVIIRDTDGHSKLVGVPGKLLNS